MTGQRIEQLDVTNVMGIKRISYAPSEPVIIVEGGNGKGKTSFMTAIALLLNDKTTLKNVNHLIRDGEDFATVSAKLTNMTVSRKWLKSGKSRVEILNADGNRFASPIDMLEKITGKLPFDPTRFDALAPKERTQTFLSLIKTDEDFDDLERQKETAYRKRTEVNRDKKKAEVKKQSFSNDYPDAPGKELSMSELSQSLTDALAIEEQHRIDIATKDKNTLALANKQEQIDHLIYEMDILKENNGDLATSISNYENPNVSSIQDTIKNSEEINKQVRYMANKSMYVAEYKVLSEESELLTQELKDIQATKEYTIQHAELPIEGLSLNEDNEILYNGKPYDDCSTAERLKVATAIAIGTQPESENQIKVMLIQHGNNLDSKNMKYLTDYCTNLGYQLWVEMVVDRPSGTGIFIEDGEILNGA